MTTSIIIIEREKTLKTYPYKYLVTLASGYVFDVNCTSPARVKKYHKLLNFTSPIIKIEQLSKYPTRNEADI